MYNGYTWLFKRFCYIAANADEVENAEESADSLGTSTVPHSSQFLASQQYLSPQVAASKAADTSKKG